MVLSLFRPKYKRMHSVISMPLDHRANQSFLIIDVIFLNSKRITLQEILYFIQRVHGFSIIDTIQPGL